MTNLHQTANTPVEASLQDGLKRLTYIERIKMKKKISLDFNQEKKLVPKEPQ